MNALALKLLLISELRYYSAWRNIKMEKLLPFTCLLLLTVIYSCAENENSFRTGVVEEEPDSSVILQSTGKIGVPHDAKLDGVYEEKGNFNDKKYYKHLFCRVV